MMEKRRLTREHYRKVEDAVKREGGDTSFAGRQHQEETGKLHALVDPAGYGLIRKSLPRYVLRKDGNLDLESGTPMLIENLLDTTGSMHENIQLAFNALPDQYDLLANGDNPVLIRYDPQILNAIFGDIVDNYVLSRTQAEMDEKIAEQLTLMVPEGRGGDPAEDPEYGLFGAAFLTDAFINQYGLKSYHFMITDAPSHGRIDNQNLERVFGSKVYDVVNKNGYQLNKDDLPDTREIVTELLKKAHAFAIIVGYGSVDYWENYYGQKNVIQVNSTENLHYVEAVIIGLTEGVLDLQSVPDYLQSVGCEKEIAAEIQRSVANIPLAAQQLAPNFGKIPAKGSVFANKRELWPIAAEVTEQDSSENGETWL